MHNLKFWFRLAGYGEQGPRTLIVFCVHLECQTANNKSVLYLKPGASSAPARKQIHVTLNYIKLLT